MNIAEIAKDIRARRRALEINQKELSTAAGVGMSTIVNIELGDNLNPGVATVTAILTALERFEHEAGIVRPEDGVGN